MAGAIAIIILSMLIGFIPGYIWGKSDREDKKKKAEAEQKPVIERKEYNLRTYHETATLPFGAHYPRIRAQYVQSLYRCLADRMCADSLGDIKVVAFDDSMGTEEVELTITVAEEDKEWINQY